MYRPAKPLKLRKGNFGGSSGNGRPETTLRRQLPPGPHRDDFGIYVDGRDAGSFASRGEARTIALALRLAEADYLADLRGEDPIILLDDVFSEMDAGRRERVLKKTAAYRQTLMTTTDVEPVRAVLGDEATYFRVFDNTVQRES